MTKYKNKGKQSISPEIISNQKESIRINKEISSMQEKYDLSKKYIEYRNQLEEAKEVINTETDTEMIEMAKEQKKESELALQETENKLKIALLPQDPNDEPADKLLEKIREEKEKCENNCDALPVYTRSG